MSSNKPLAKVCFVIDDLSLAGTETQLLQTIENLDRSKVTPFLCLLNGTNPKSRLLEPRNCETIRLGITKLFSARAVRKSITFYRFIKQNNINVVQTFFPDSTRFASPIAKAAGVSLILGSRRNVGHWMTNWDKRIARIYNRLFIDKIVANCDAARQAAIDQENANPSNVVVLPNIIDRTRFTTANSNEQILKGPDINIGMVGNLREVKGPDLFISAAKLVIDQHSNVNFCIAGGGNQTPYHKQIDALGINKQVRLLGPVKNVADLLGSLDIAILPSRAEGLSNALLEYMAAGRPIIATRVGGNSELIMHEENGLLVAPSRIDIAEAIKQFIENPDFARKLAKNALSTVPVSQPYHTIWESIELS